MNEIKIFNNSQFGEIRTATTESGDPLFVALDVCNALGYTKPRNAVSQHVDPEDALKQGIPTAGGIQEMTLINESGVYSLVFGSKLETAKQFKKWVTSEVLPAIRKTGGYIATKQDDTPEMIMARAVLVAQESINRLKTQLEAQAPKVLFADSVSTSNGSCLIAELAKILNQNGIPTGQNRLFAYLRENGYLCKSGEYYNQPTQRAMDMGLFEIKKTAINKPDGTVLMSITTKVTGKGQIYFVNLFLGKSKKAA